MIKKIIETEKQNNFVLEVEFCIHLMAVGCVERKWLEGILAAAHMEWLFMVGEWFYRFVSTGHSLWKQLEKLLWANFCFLEPQSSF